MDKKGTIKKVFPPRSGEGNHGRWMMQTVVIECQEGNNTSYLVGDISGEDRINRLNPTEGQYVQAWFDVDGHCWNDKWFPDVRIYDIRPATSAEAAQ